MLIKFKGPRKSMDKNGETSDMFGPSETMRLLRKQNRHIERDLLHNCGTRTEKQDGMRNAVFGTVRARSVARRNNTQGP